MVLHIAFIPSLFKLFLERFNIFILNYIFPVYNAKENIYPNDFPNRLNLQLLQYILYSSY